MRRIKKGNDDAASRGAIETGSARWDCVDKLTFVITFVLTVRTGDTADALELALPAVQITKEHNHFVALAAINATYDSPS